MINNYGEKHQDISVQKGFRKTEPSLFQNFNQSFEFTKIIELWKKN